MIGVSRLRSRHADQFRGLVAVEVGHRDVEQDQGEIALQHLLERGAAGRGADEVVGGLDEDGLERQQVLLVIVDEQDVDLLRHARVPSTRVTR